MLGSTGRPRSLTADSAHNNTTQNSTHSTQTHAHRHTHTHSDTAPHAQDTHTRTTSRNTNVHAQQHQHTHTHTHTHTQHTDTQTHTHTEQTQTQTHTEHTQTAQPTLDPSTGLPSGKQRAFLKAATVSRVAHRSSSPGCSGRCKTWRTATRSARPSSWPTWRATRSRCIAMLYMGYCRTQTQHTAILHSAGYYPGLKLNIPP